MEDFAKTNNFSRNQITSWNYEYKFAKNASYIKIDALQSVNIVFILQTKNWSVRAYYSK